jgi:hypothetical protein
MHRYEILSYEFALITAGKKSWKRKPYLSRALCAMESLKWQKQKSSLIEFKPRALFLCLCLGTGQGKSSFQQKDCFHQQIGLKLKKKLAKCYICSIALYGAETWTLRKVDQKYLESFKMWCWRRMGISWTDPWGTKKCYRRGEEYLTYNNKEGRLTGLVTPCVGTAF